jgi:hypothetical protein
MSKHKPESLAAMSDKELEKTLHGILGRGSGMIPAYCSDWAEIGPLMSKHKISLGYCGHNRWFATAYHVNANVVCKNPLRAAVKCLVWYYRRVNYD